MKKNIVAKKAYLKPTAGFVNFSFAGSIAATCVYAGTNTDGNTCGYLSNGWLCFAPTSVCEYPIDDEFCYHVPTEDTSVFGS